MSKVALTEEKSGFPEGVPDDVLEELADELAEEEEEEEPSPVEIAEVARRGGRQEPISSIPTSSPSAGFPCSRSKRSRNTCASLEEGKAVLKEIALSSPLAIPRVLALGANIKQGLVKAQDVLRYPGRMERLIRSGIHAPRTTG